MCSGAPRRQGCAGVRPELCKRADARGRREAEAAERGHTCGGQRELTEKVCSGEAEGARLEVKKERQRKVSY